MRLLERRPKRARALHQTSPNAVPGVFWLLLLLKHPYHRQQIRVRSWRVVFGPLRIVNVSLVLYVPAHTNIPDLQQRYKRLNKVLCVDRYWR